MGRLIMSETLADVFIDFRYKLADNGRDIKKIIVSRRTFTELAMEYQDAVYKLGVSVIFHDIDTRPGGPRSLKICGMTIEEE